jgi:hypothetical protein
MITITNKNDKKIRPILILEGTGDIFQVTTAI